MAAETHTGTTGFAKWQVFKMNDICIRKVEYSPGYVANHWCSKGYIIFCLEGKIQTTLQDGTTHLLSAGMTYHVNDNCEAHMSESKYGCKLFIVDWQGFIVRAKKQPWAASLCHSLVPHTCLVL
ncbi:MAG: DHCW motif cupin fold protein [Aquabacterium sp.]|nr:DHCW motif cupin fold protein [Ferruginibacter sp.]